MPNTLDVYGTGSTAVATLETHTLAGVQPTYE